MFGCYPIYYLENAHIELNGGFMETCDFNVKYKGIQFRKHIIVV